jgi:subtilase family serine protease
MSRLRRFVLSSNPCLSIVFTLICLLATATPLLAQTPALVTQPVDNSVRTVLPGNVHPLARPQYDQGEVAPGLVLHRIMLVLKRSDQQETALRSLIENQQYKKSPNYHQWLTPEQFGTQFGPADSDIAAVTNWLQQSGFEVTQVSKGRTVIEFTGTAGQVKQAFGTAIHKYVVNGESHLANVNNPSIPTALAPVILGVNSLHNFFKKGQNVYVGTYSEKTKQLTSPKPQYTFSCGTNCVDYAVTPFDFATIYDLLPLWNATTPVIGSNQTIAIVGRTDINPNDAPAFWQLFGFGQPGLPPVPKLNIITNGADPGFTEDEAEADIDTQWSGAAAPGATIDFVTSESTETDDGVDLSAIYIVDNNLAPVVSDSYGSCEAYENSGFYGVMWEQAAAQGMTVMVAAGDSGSAGCDNPNSPAAQYGLDVNETASTPFNVAVGGTDFNQYEKWTNYWNSTNNAVTQESAKGPIPETTWNDSCTNGILQFLSGGSTNPETNCNNPNFSGFLDVTGGSGGASGEDGLGFGWLKPTWQAGLGVPNDNARDLPDVSLFASNGFLNSFYLICQSDQVGGTCTLDNLLGFGGTSVSSPAFAGIMALVNQLYGPQGVANFVLYNLVSKVPTAFHDVPAGSTNSMPCYTGTPNCTTNTAGDAYGVLTTPASSSVEAWNTTANYDLATGLGSVDASVLVNNWNKATFTPTTTTLTVNSGNPVNVTHGTSVSVTVSVSPSPGSGSDTMAEDVALLTSPGNMGIDWNSLTGGTVTWPTTLLPGGTYKIIAHYGGDKNLGGSYSSPSQSVTVNPESSSVYMPGVVNGVDANGNPTYVNTVVYGTGEGYLYLLRADVLNSQAQYCTTEVEGEIACPTGTINFTDNGGALDGGTFKMNGNGYTEDQGIQLTGAGSPHTLVAAYSGDASYKKSTSPSAVVTVTLAPTLINNVSAPATANPGQQITLGATVSTQSTTTSYGVAPTGAVKFFSNGTLIGTATTTPTAGNINLGIPASLAATLSTSFATAGTYTITATYAGDSNYQAVTTSNSVQVVVAAAASFTLSAAPSSLTVAQGSNGTSTITVTPANGFTGSVTLAASGLPSGVTAAFAPNPTTTTSVLTLTASSSAAIGTATVTVTGTSGSLMATTTISLTVTAPSSFTLSANPTSLSIVQGSMGTSTITVTDVGGFTGSVTLAASGLPSGVTAAFATNPTTSTSVLTLTASASAAVGGPTTVTITGTSGSLMATTTIALTVTAAPNFTLSANPTSLSIAQGAMGTSTITVTSQNGFNSATTLSATGLPNGVTAAFSPNPVTPPANGMVNSTLTLTASATATTGPATVTVTGKSGSLTQTATISLTVTPPPNFTLSAAPSSVTITPGAAGGTSTITVNPTNGFTGSVTLAASGLPSGVTAAFGTNPTTGTSILTLTASGSASAGMSTVTVTGTSGSLTPETTTINLTVTPPPNFTLSASPTSLSIAQGANGTSTITVVPTNGFTGSVMLAASGLPSGVTAAFGTNPATSTSVLTLTASSSATTGTATVTITGTSGSLAPETTTVALTVFGFTVPGTLNPPAAASPGQTTSTTMLISPAGSSTFASNVTFTSSGLPTGATLAFNPTQINAGASGQQTVTITVDTAGPFTGTAGSAQGENDRPRLRSQNQRLWLPLSLPLAGIVVVGLFGQGLPRRYKIVGLCLALVLAGTLVACGTGNSSPPPVTVTVSPSSVSTLYPNESGFPAQTQQFTATVNNSTNQTVTWAVTGGSGNGSISTSGLYTAPATLPTPANVTVTATSTVATSPGSATVNLLTPTPAGTSTVTVTVTEGTVVHTTTFSLTVN